MQLNSVVSYLLKVRGSTALPWAAAAAIATTFWMIQNGDF
jgi:hypothetical protein